jgi:hypothetical protein
MQLTLNPEDLAECMRNENMKFEFKKIPTGEAYFSGNYKVVKYGDHWFAFVKAELAKNWGMSCYHGKDGSMRYSTKEEAMDACKKHVRK